MKIFSSNLHDSQKSSWQPRGPEDPSGNPDPWTPPRPATPLSGPAQPAWLKAAAALFRCRPGRGHIVAAARLQLVLVIIITNLLI